MRARASAATKPSGSAHYKGRMGCVPIWKTQARLPLQRSQVNQHTANVERHLKKMSVIDILLHLNWEHPSFGIQSHLTSAFYFTKE
jgi:hypothetical protein